MDGFLILYVLGLMILFFFLGAAIGGAARSFKSYMFGQKHRDGLAEAAIAGAAIAGTAVATDHIANTANQQETVKVTSDELIINPADEWAQETVEQEEPLDLAADISRNETVNEETAEIYEQAEPLAETEIPSAQELGDAEVYRDDEGAKEAFYETAQETIGAEPVLEQRIEAEIQPEDTSAINADVVENNIHEEPEAAEQELIQPDNIVSEIVEEQIETERQEPEAEIPVEEMPVQEEPVAIATEAPLVWDYTNKEDDYSDIIFITEGDNDDLTKIRGITSEVDAVLNELGLRRYDQIAALTSRQVEFLKTKLGFTSELNEQGWIEQAKILASGALTAYAASLMGEATLDNDAKAEQSEDLVEEAAQEQAEDEELVAQELAPEQELDPEGYHSEGEISEELTEEPEATQTDDDEDKLSLAAIAAAGLTAQAATEMLSKEAQSEEEPQISKLVEPETELEQVQAENDTETEIVAEAEVHDAHKEAETQAELQTEPLNEGETERQERKTRDEHRLFGEKERLQRDEEWRTRYQRERVIQPRENANNHTAVNQADPADTNDEAEPVIEEAINEPHNQDQIANFTPAETQIAEPEFVEPESQTEGRPVDSDDLKQIQFISTSLEKKLNLLGVYKLSQIANWTPEVISEISEQLEFRDDRIIKEDWMGHAQQALDLKQKDHSPEKSGLFSASDLIARLEQLDKITDLTEHEKTMLSNNGITELSQIANWSGADVNWAKSLLEIENVERVQSWVETASTLINAGKNDIPGGVALGSEQDMKRIRGLDQDAEDLLNSIGVTTYSQIAEWQQKEMDRVNDLLGTTGRVEREYWVVQAKVLKDGGATDFSKLYDEK